MRARVVPDRDRGFVAIELVLAIGLLLLPVVLLVTALPSWIEREHAASVAARDAATAAVAAYPADGRDAAQVAAFDALADYGIAADDVVIAFDRDDVRRGGTVAVRVTIRMPALVVPGIGTAGGFHWSVVHTRRIDDYRSA